MKAVIFDFNGTLFNDHEKHVEAWSQITMRLIGEPITSSELAKNMSGCNNTQLLNALSGHTLSQEEMDALSKEKEALYRQICMDQPESFHLVKGATELFDYLKQNNIPFTIASASIWDNISFFIDSFGLDKWIEPENIVYDDGINKNKTEMLFKAADMLHTDIKDCLVFEDSITGVNAALEAGVEDIRIIDTAKTGAAFANCPQVKQIVDDFTQIDLDGFAPEKE